MGEKVPHGVTITWEGPQTEVKEVDKDGDEEMPPEEDTNEPTTVTKTMDIFCANSDRLEQKRFITWHRDRSFELGVQYTDTASQISKYQIQMDPQTEKKKVKIEVKMTLNGIFQIDNAHIVEIEEYEEIVKE